MKCIRILSIFLALAMAFPLAACSSEPESPLSNDTEISAETTVPVETELKDGVPDGLTFAD